MADMSHHHRGRRTTVPPPAPIQFAPHVTDPVRLAGVKAADGEIGIRLLEWQHEFALTSAELLSLMRQCRLDQLSAVIRSERSGGRPGVGLGGPSDLEPKPEK
jgi:hypothetical protein